jgi:hypothetical protein
MIPRTYLNDLLYVHLMCSMDLYSQQQLYRNPSMTTILLRVLMFSMLSTSILSPFLFPDPFIDLWQSLQSEFIT